MSRIPPHLPPPTCNIETHRRMQRLKILTAAAVFGLAAGLSGAAMMIGWIWPGYGGGDIWAVSQMRTSLSRAQLETRVQKELTDRVVTVYSGSHPLVESVSYFGEQNKLGEAMIVSSDGWLAIYLPAFDGIYKNLFALQQNGAVHKIEKALLDRNAGVLYLKMALSEQEISSGSQFKVVSFSDTVESWNEIYVYQQKYWYRGTISYPVEESPQAIHADTLPIDFFTLDGSFAEGGIAINSQGQVTGLVKNGGKLVPNTYITRILPGVLSQQKISYPTLGVEGWFSSEQPVIVDDEKVDGFAVFRASAKNSLLHKGDIITEINGQIVTPDSLWYNMKNAEVKLNVLRGGKVLEVSVKVSETQ